MYGIIVILLIQVIKLSKSVHVKFNNFICDDYCTDIYIGEKLIQSYPKTTESEFKEHTFTAEMPLVSNFKLIVSNLGLGIYIRGTINFYYFSLSTKYKELWTVGEPNEKCIYADTPTYPNDSINIANLRRYADNTSCTFTFNLCSNLKYNYNSITESTPFSFTDLLLLKDITVFSNLKPMFVLSSQFAQAIKVNNVLLSSENQINLADSFTYVKTVNKNSIDIAYLEFWDKITNDKVIQCSITFTICENTCNKCNYDTKFCDECKPWIFI